MKQIEWVDIVFSVLLHAVNIICISMKKKHLTCFKIGTLKFSIIVLSVSGLECFIDLKSILCYKNSLNVAFRVTGTLTISFR